MPYNINRYNGALVATVEDGTVDNTLDIKLIGRNYAGYGEVQNENMVHLLENFAGTSEPPRKIAGQIWYDSATKKLKFYDGDKFRTTGGAEVGTAQPSGLTTGDFWWNTDTQQLYAWSGSAFTLVGPQAVENKGATELKSVSVTDINGTTHAIVKALVNNKTIFIISGTQFELAPNTIEGFILIKKGITLVDTTETNVADPDYGVTSSQYIYWGTASNALKLDGLSANEFVRAGNPNFTGLVSFTDDGFTVGNDDDIKFYINEGNPTLDSVIDNATIVFRTKLSGDINLKNPMKLNGNDILPGAHLLSNVGRADQKFNGMYAVDFYGSLRGTADRAALLNVDGSFINGSVAATPNTLASRDTNGAITASQFLGLASRATNINGGVAGSIPYQTAVNTTSFIGIGALNEVLTVSAGGQLDWRPITDLVNAGNADAIAITTSNLTNSTHYITFVDGTSGYNPIKIDTSALTYNPNTNTITTGFFNGRATQASYADLAEKFLPDKEYEVGTVVVVGGEKEVTESTFGKRAIGVVSAYPAYLMNNELEGGIAIALKGRVPVKVVGAVYKGNQLVAGDNGCAQPVMTGSHNVFAIALETNTSHGSKIVECVIL